MSKEKGGDDPRKYDFSGFSNVELIGVDLYRAGRRTVRDAVPAGAVLSGDDRRGHGHAAGDRLSRRGIHPHERTAADGEEYFADIESGALRYFTIGIDRPTVEVDGDAASVTYTSVLNANAYGARGTFRMSGTHWFEKRDGAWISVNR